VAVTLVVVLSRRVGASVFIVVGLAAAAASFALGREWSPITASVLDHGGFMLAFSALVWVLAHALYAPGRITFHRLQGAMVIYLSLATIFANAFGFVWQLVPGAFANLAPAAPGASEFASMLYFSLATLTTTGYGDIVPLNPFARSLASLESVIGPFYLAITVARLVTMELDDRRRSRQ
jgi:voltage-gated potassium channel Kch